MNHTESLRIAPSGERALVIERTFDAPAALVWRAMTEAHLLRRWMGGPPGWTMSECESHLTVGGTFRHAWTGPEGARMAMSGEYREIKAPRRLVRNERFEFGCDAQAGEQLGVLELSDLPGGSTGIRIHVTYPSAEAATERWRRAWNRAWRLDTNSSTCFSSKNRARSNPRGPQRLVGPGAAAAHFAVLTVIAGPGPIHPGARVHGNRNSFSPRITPGESSCAMDGWPSNPGCFARGRQDRASRNYPQSNSIRREPFR